MSSNDNGGVLKILKFTNLVGEEDLVLEDCSSYSEVLSTYHICLDRKYLSDMKYYLMSLYKGQQELVDGVFDGGVDSRIIQLCQIYRGESTYTEMFIKDAGGVENLIGGRSNGLLDSSDLDSEEEEEEMYREMYEKLKEEMDAKVKELTQEVEVLNTEVMSLKEFKQIFDDREDLEDEDLDGIMDALQSLKQEDYEELLFDILSINVSEDSDDLKDSKILKLYINDIVQWLDDNGHLDEEIQSEVVR